MRLMCCVLLYYNYQGPGMNKPGGVARVTKVYPSKEDHPEAYDGESAPHSCRLTVVDLYRWPGHDVWN